MSMEDNKVAVLIEDMMSQFRVFGEGLQQLNDQMNRRFDKVDQRFDGIDKRLDQNDMEHQALKLMIQEIASDQEEIKQKLNDLDQEFEIKLGRIK